MIAELDPKIGYKKAYEEFGGLVSTRRSIFTIREAAKIAGIDCRNSIKNKIKIGMAASEIGIEQRNHLTKDQIVRIAIQAVGLKFPESNESELQAISAKATREGDVGLGSKVESKADDQKTPLKIAMEYLKEFGKDGDYSFGSIARAMGYVSAPVQGTITRKIRMTATKALGRPVLEKRAHFSWEEAVKTMELYLETKENPDFKKAKQKNDKNTVIFRGNEINFSKDAELRIKVLKILDGTSEEHPISTTVLARMIFGGEISIKDAKNRLAGIIFGLRLKLEPLGFFINKAKVIKENTEPRNRDKAAYYMSIVKESVRKVDRIAKSSVVKRKRKANKKSLLPNVSPAVSSSVVNVMEKAGIKKSEVKGQEVRPSVGKIPARADIFNTAPKTKEPKEMPKINLPLTDEDIFVIIRRLSTISRTNKSLLDSEHINQQPFISNRKELDMVITRVIKKLSDDKIRWADFESRVENVTSVRGKLSAYAADPFRYSKSCSAEARILLGCFDRKVIGEAFLNLFFPFQLGATQNPTVGKGA